MLFKKEVPIASPSTEAIVDKSRMPSIMSEMLISKLAHDLASPVGAVENGLELLGDDLQGDFAGEALSMVKESARTVASRLKTYRVAYGTANGASSYHPQALFDLLENFFASEKRLTLKTSSIPKDLTDIEKKLLVNIVLCAASALPRGGELAVDITNGLKVTAISSDAAHPPKSDSIAIDQPIPDDLSPYTVQAFYTGWYGSSVNIKLNQSLDGAVLVIRT